MNSFFVPFSPAETSFYHSSFYLPTLEEKVEPFHKLEFNPYVSLSMIKGFDTTAGLIVDSDAGVQVKSISISKNKGVLVYSGIDQQDLVAAQAADLAAFNELERRKCYVGNLTNGLNAQQIKDFFEENGFPSVQVSIPKLKSEVTKGFCFVIFSSEEDALSSESIQATLTATIGKKKQTCNPIISARVHSIHE